MPHGFLYFKKHFSKLFQKRNGYKFMTAVFNGHSQTGTGLRSGVTAVVVGQRQRVYSGFRMLAWFSISSININISGWGKGAEMGSKPLAYIYVYIYIYMYTYQ